MRYACISEFADTGRTGSRGRKGKQRMAKATDSQLNRNTKRSAERRQTTPVSVCGDIISGVVAVYVFVMLTAFPLFATDMYFNILVDRYYFFWIATAAMTGISAAAALVCLFVDWKENQLQNFRALFFDDTEQACESASQKEAAGTKQAAQRKGKAGQTGKTAERNGAGRAVRLKLRSHLRAADCFLLVFLLVALLSTLCSDWLYEAFWGNMGRFQGLFLWIWYAAAYFMVTRFFRFYRIYLDIALAVGLYMAVWGIQDYLGLDPHGWLSEVDSLQKAMFTSSIGNINTYTAVIGLYMAISAVLFVGEGRKEAAAGSRAAGAHGQYGHGQHGLSKYLPALRSCYYAACVVIFFMAMIAGQSDNAVLGIAAVLCFLPFYAWKDRRGFVRYFLVAAGFFGAMALVRALTLQFEPELSGFWSGTLLGLSEKTVNAKLTAGCLLLAAAAWAVCLALNGRGRKGQAEMAASAGRGGKAELAAHAGRSAKTTGEARRPLSFVYEAALSKPLPTYFRLIWLALGALALAVLIWLFWDANHGGHPEWYAPYSNIFYFNYDWGTHRGHNWSILMRHFQEFPLWKKLIGAGPETYGIVTRIYDYSEMSKLYGEIYDSPHNEFLQYLFTTGILGFVSYYGFIAANCLRALNIRRLPLNVQTGGACGTAAVFAAAAYAAQSFINISVPIVVPLMLMFLFIGTTAEQN